MAGGGGGDGDVSRAQQPSRGERRGHSQKALCLPLDVIAEIAARSDPATLVRCAATCRDARRRIAEDPSLLGRLRLRLRDTERFFLPLLRGHLTGITTYDSGSGRWKTGVYMVDTTTAADATRLVKADETLSNVEPLDSRGGLVLARNHQLGLLLVCDMATRRCQALPPEPAFPDVTASVKYVLLVVGNRDDGEGAVGRPYQVLKASLVLSEYCSSSRLLLVHTFSSEPGAWSSLTEIPIPNLLGSGHWLSRSLVIGDVVHWLCLTKSGSYMVMLHVGGARVNVTSLPASFPRNCWSDSFDERYQYLLSTAKAGGNPVVLVADANRISVWEWEQSKPQPQVVIENETVLGFKDDGLAELIEKEMRWGMKRGKHVPELLWFGERSGVVLIRIHGFCLLWLDLQSKKIVRCFSDRRLLYAQVYCPYEVDLSLGANLH